MEVIPLRIAQSLRNVAAVFGAHNIALGCQHFGTKGVQKSGNLASNRAVTDDSHRAAAQFDRFQLFDAMLMPDFLLLKTKHLGRLMPQHQQRHQNIFAHLADHRAAGACQLHAAPEGNFVLESAIHAGKVKLHPL